MINYILEEICADLNEFLRLRYSLTDDIVVLTPVRKDGSELSIYNNKVVVTAISFERDKDRKGEQGKAGYEKYMLLMRFMVAVVFDEKNYNQSLLIFWGLLEYFQTKSNYVVSINEDEEFSVKIDFENPSFQDLSNIWGLFGGSYYPSLIFKLTNIPVDAGEEEFESGKITSTSFKIKNKIK
ncbi:MAG: DUF4255 domain-containing protein [Marinifilaceae bacterium]|jgi:hypothetical protein|nr:DUF4255 domain-containing protein [Marinifilaceae bacterium]